MANTTGELRGKSVLELGSAAGVAVEGLRRLGGVDAVGVEANPDFVEFANRHGVPLVCSNLYEVPDSLKDRSFDLTFSHLFFDALVSVSKNPDGSSEYRRMEHTEELAVLETIAKLTPPGAFSIHYTMFTIPFSHEEFEQAGFKIIEFNEKWTFVVLRKMTEVEVIAQRSDESQKTLQTIEPLLEKIRKIGKGDTTIPWDGRKDGVWSFLEEEIVEVADKKLLFDKLMESIMQEELFTREQLNLLNGVFFFLGDRFLDAEGAFSISEEQYLRLWKICEMAGHINFEKQVVLMIIAAILKDPRISIDGWPDKKEAITIADKKIREFLKYLKMLKDENREDYMKLASIPWAKFIDQSQRPFLEKILLDSGEENEFSGMRNLLLDYILIPLCKKSTWARKVSSGLVLSTLKLDFSQEINDGESVCRILFDDQSNAKEFFRVASLLRKIYPFDMARDDSRAPLKYALEEKIFFRISPGIFMTPMTESFRRHIIFSIEEGAETEPDIDAVKFAFEILIPGERDGRGEVFVKDRWDLSKEMQEKYPEERYGVQPIYKKEFPQDTYELYGKNVGFYPRAPLRVIAFEYKDGKRLEFVSGLVLEAIASGLGWDIETLETEIIKQTAGCVAATHQLGYVGHEYGKNGLMRDHHIGNFRLLVNNSAIKVQLVGDFESFTEQEKFKDPDEERKIDVESIIMDSGGLGASGLEELLSMQEGKIRRIFKNAYDSVKPPVLRKNKNLPAKSSFHSEFEEIRPSQYRVFEILWNDIGGSDLTVKELSKKTKGDTKTTIGKLKYLTTKAVRHSLRILYYLGLVDRKGKSGVAVFKAADLDPAEDNMIFQILDLMGDSPGKKETIEAREMIDICRELISDFEDKIGDSRYYAKHVIPSLLVQVEDLDTLKENIYFIKDHTDVGMNPTSFILNTLPRFLNGDYGLSANKHDAPILKIVVPASAVGVKKGLTTRSKEGEIPLATTDISFDGRPIYLPIEELEDEEQSDPAGPAVALIKLKDMWVQYDLSEEQHLVINEAWGKLWDVGYELPENDDIVHDIKEKLESYPVKLSVNIHSPPDKELHDLIYKLAAEQDVNFPPRDQFRLITHPGTYRNEQGKSRSYNMLIPSGTLSFLMDIRKTAPEAYKEWLDHEIAHLIDRVNKPKGHEKKEAEITEGCSIEKFIKEYEFHVGADEVYEDVIPLDDFMSLVMRDDGSEAVMLGDSYFSYRSAFGVEKIWNLADKEVLVIGCGSGTLCFEAFWAGAKRAVGVDVDKNSIAMAKILSQFIHIPEMESELQRLAPRPRVLHALITEYEKRETSDELEFITSSAADLTMLKDNSFDIASIPFVFDAVNGIGDSETKRRTISHVLRALRPGGTLSVYPVCSKETLFEISAAMESMAKDPKVSGYKAKRFVQRQGYVDEYLFEVVLADMEPPGKSGNETPAIALIKLKDMWVQYDLSEEQHLVINEAWGELWEEGYELPQEHSLVLTVKEKLIKKNIKGDVHIHSPPAEMFYDKIYRIALDLGVNMPDRKIFKLVTHPGTYRNENTPRSYNLLIPRKERRFLTKLRKKNKEAYREWLRHEIAHLEERAKGAIKPEKEVRKAHSIGNLIDAYNGIGFGRDSQFLGINKKKKRGLRRALEMAKNSHLNPNYYNPLLTVISIVLSGDEKSVMFVRKKGETKWRLLENEAVIFEDFTETMMRNLTRWTDRRNIRTHDLIDVESDPLRREVYTFSPVVRVVLDDDGSDLKVPPDHEVNFIEMSRVQRELIHPDHREVVERFTEKSNNAVRGKREIEIYDINTREVMSPFYESMKSRKTRERHRQIIENGDVQPNVNVTGIIELYNDDDTFRGVLVVQDKRGYWTGVGGHPEHGEDVLHAQFRELYEELGLREARIDRLFDISRKWSSDRYPTYWGILPVVKAKGEPVIGGGEIFGWALIEDLEGLKQFTQNHSVGWDWYTIFAGYFLEREDKKLSDGFISPLPEREIANLHKKLKHIFSGYDMSDKRMRFVIRSLSILLQEITENKKKYLWHYDPLGIRFALKSPLHDFLVEGLYAAIEAQPSAKSFVSMLRKDGGVYLPVSESFWIYDANGSVRLHDMAAPQEVSGKSAMFLSLFESVKTALWRGNADSFVLHDPEDPVFRDNIALSSSRTSATLGPADVSLDNLRHEGKIHHLLGEEIGNISSDVKKIVSELIQDLSYRHDVSRMYKLPERLELEIFKIIFASKMIEVLSGEENSLSVEKGVLKRSEEDVAQEFIDKIFIAAFEASRKPEGKEKIIVGIDASWIPRVQKVSCMKGLIKSLNALPERLGLDNMKIIVASDGKQLVREIRSEMSMEDINVPRSNLVILGDKNELELEMFDIFRNVDNKGESAFFAKIISPEEGFPDNSYIRLMEMVVMALDLAFEGELTTGGYRHTQYERGSSNRTYLFMPIPDAIEFKEDMIELLYCAQADLISKGA